MARGLICRRGEVTVALAATSAFGDDDLFVVVGDVGEF